MQVVIPNVTSLTISWGNSSLQHSSNEKMVPYTLPNSSLCAIQLSCKEQKLFCKTRMANCPLAQDFSVLKPEEFQQSRMMVILRVKIHTPSAEGPEDVCSPRGWIYSFGLKVLWKHCLSGQRTVGKCRSTSLSLDFPGSGFPKWLFYFSYMDHDCFCILGKIQNSISWINQKISFELFTL